MENLHSLVDEVYETMMVMEDDGVLKRVLQMAFDDEELSHLLVSLDAAAEQIGY